MGASIYEEFLVVQERLGEVEALAEAVPADLEELAREAGFRVKRKKTGSMWTVLCLILDVVCISGSSRATAAKYSVMGWSEISHAGLCELLGRACGWLEAIAKWQMAKLRERCSRIGGFHIVAVDATNLSTTTPQGDSFSHRAHVMMDVLTKTLVAIYTDPLRKRGETLLNFTLSKGMLILADRAYCTAVSILHALSASADLIVRYKRGLGLYTDSQCLHPVHIPKLFETLKEGDVSDTAVYIKRRVQDSFVQVRLLILDLGEKQVPRELEKLKYGKQKLTAEAILFARYLVLLTTVTDTKRLSSEKVLKLYRMRWQVELYFKHLKTLLGMRTSHFKTSNALLSWMLAHIIYFNIFAIISTRTNTHVHTQAAWGSRIAYLWRAFSPALAVAISPLRLPDLHTASHDAALHLFQRAPTTRTLAHKRLIALFPHEETRTHSSGSPPDS